MTATDFGLRFSYRGLPYKLVSGPTFRCNRRGTTAQEKYIVRLGWPNDEPPLLYPASESAGRPGVYPRDLINEFFRMPHSDVGAEAHITQAQALKIISRTRPSWLLPAVADGYRISNFGSHMMPGTETGWYGNHDDSHRASHISHAFGELRVASIHMEPINSDRPGDPWRYDYLWNDENALETSREWNETYESYYMVTVDYDSNANEFEYEANSSGRFLSLSPTKTRTSDLDVYGEGDWTLKKSQVTDQDRAPVKKLRTSTEHVLRFQSVINPNLREMTAALGKINSEPIPLFNNAPKNTVLFVGFSADRLRNLDRATTLLLEWPRYSMELHFQQMMTEEDDNIYGHNFVYYPKIGRWVYVTRGTENNPIYQRYDFWRELRHFPGVEWFVDSQESTMIPET